MVVDKIIIVYKIIFSLSRSRGPGAGISLGCSWQQRPGPELLASEFTGRGAGPDHGQSAE